MGQIEDLKLFVTVVDQGGIAKAAETLGIAKSAVSRRLAMLEDRYSMRLVDRQPGTWEVTTGGQELYQRSVGIVSDIEDLDADFVQTSVSIGGPLRVSIAREFGLAFLKPTLFEFIENHPEINLTIDFDDRMVDLDSENYDLAVRITDVELPEFEVIKLGSTTHGLYASKEYLEENGCPEDVTALRSRPLLHYGAERRPRWDVIHGEKRRSIEFQPVLNSNNGPFLVEAAIKGLGIVRMPRFLLNEAVDDGSLVRILPDLRFETFGIFVVFSKHRRINRRMRLLINALSQCCAVLQE